MTKSELMIRLAELYTANNDSTILNAKDVEQSVKIIVDTMTRALAKGQRIEIRGFGSFDLNHRPARLGRNPKTGEKVNVPEKYVPHFKPGKELRERVDNTLLSKNR
jgi:integration host factor subunit beta